jgi:steroid delta-isomerase-like uncharacterized protein
MTSTKPTDNPTQHTPDELKTLIREFFRKAYTEGNEQVIDELLAPDVLMHGLGPEPTVGREPFRRWYHAFRGAFTNIHCSVTHVCIEDDLLAVRVLFTGTHSTASLGPPPTGKLVSVTAVVLCRFEQGKVVEAFNEFDHLSLMQQLGAIPAMPAP